MSDNPSCAYIASSDMIAVRKAAIDAHRKMNPHVVENASCFRCLDFNEQTEDKTGESQKKKRKIE